MGRAGEKLVVGSWAELTCGALFSAGFSGVGCLSATGFVVTGFVVTGFGAGDGFETAAGFAGVVAWFADAFGAGAFLAGGADSSS